MSPSGLLAAPTTPTRPPDGGNHWWRWALACGLAVLAVPAGMVVIATATLFSAPTDQEGGQDVSASPCLELAGAGPVDSLTAEQAGNARAIIQAGRAAKVPVGGLVVAIATALQESGLRNLDHGDRDSVGLFQQRRPWGGLDERMDPATSASMFFSGGHDVDGAGPDGVEPGLLSIANWQAMGVAEAAQAVQRSAFPTAYAKWEGLATGTVTTILGTSPVSCTGAGAPTGDCPPYQPASVEAGLTPDLIAVLRCGAGAFVELDSWGCLSRSGHVSNSDHYTGRACDIMMPHWQEESGIVRGDAVAAYFQKNAAYYGITYIIWRARIWNSDRADEGWRPYSHPGGRTDPTALHMDHVHVSVHGSTGTYGWSKT